MVLLLFTLSQQHGNIIRIDTILVKTNNDIRMVGCLCKELVTLHGVYYTSRLVLSGIGSSLWQCCVDMKFRKAIHNSGTCLWSSQKSLTCTKWDAIWILDFQPLSNQVEANVTTLIPNAQNMETLTSEFSSKPQSCFTYRSTLQSHYGPHSVQMF